MPDVAGISGIDAGRAECATVIIDTQAGREFLWEGMLVTLSEGLQVGWKRRRFIFANDRLKGDGLGTIEAMIADAGRR